jgi:hypothetical protein
VDAPKLPLGDYTLCGYKIMQHELLPQDVILVHPKTFQAIKAAMEERMFAPPGPVILEAHEQKL